MVGVQSGADKMYEEAILEVRKLRAQMQLTFDTCQDDAGRSVRREVKKARTLLYFCYKLLGLQSFCG